MQAIDTAHLLQLKNSHDDAEKLLHAAITYFDRPDAIITYFMETGKAQALALLGQKQAALTELRLQVDQGWRLLWRWNTEFNPNFVSLRDEPEYQAIIEILRTDMARQAAEFQALEASGEFPPPFGDDEPMSFFNELKRRNVFKVAAAYIIVGWLIMQGR